MLPNSWISTIIFSKEDSSSFRSLIYKAEAAPLSVAEPIPVRTCPTNTTQKFCGLKANSRKPQSRNIFPSAKVRRGETRSKKSDVGISIIDEEISKPVLAKVINARLKPASRKYVIS